MGIAVYEFKDLQEKVVVDTETGEVLETIKINQDANQRRLF